MSTSPRRTFLKVAGAGAISLTLANRQSKAVEANDRLRVAVIGTGGMGSSHVATLAARKDAELVYVCDVDEQRLAKAADTDVASTGKKPMPVSDLRKILDDKSIDAVYIATPDHWHTPAAILALDAGKHVYVEKPCCHNIREGRLLADAVQRNGKILQVGTQSRSAPFLKEAMQRIHSGEIGEIMVAKAWNSQRRGTIGKQQPGKPPAHLDFKAWLGPVPEVAFQANMLHSIWRWWYDFGCGDIGNDGVHDIDVALWGLGVTTHPSQIASLGGKYFFDDDQQFPDTHYVVCEYPVDGPPQGRRKQLIFEQRIWSPYVQEGYENGAAFYGTRGMMLVGHTVGWKLFGERNKLIAEADGRPNLTDHYDDFFGCIRGDQQQPAADVLAGHRAATICHLANISARVQRVLQFDPEKETFSGDDEANRLVSRKYRAGHWAVPQGV